MAAARLASRVEPLVACTPEEVERQRNNTGSHALVVALITTNYMQLDLADVLLYLYLARSSSGCEFVHLFTKMKLITLTATLVFRPLCGYVTDALASHQHWVLLIAGFVELACLVAMHVIAMTSEAYDPWILLGLQAVKNLTEVQVYTSIWKILKMRLEFRYKIRCGVQCSILSRVGMTGEASELCGNFIVFTTAYLFVKRSVGDFDTVLWLFFLAVLGATLALIGITLYVIKRGVYFSARETAADTVTISYAPPEPGFDSDSDGTASIQTDALLIPKPRLSTSSLPYDDTDLDSVQVSTNPLSYLKDTCALIFGNVVARGALTTQFLVYLPYSVYNNAEYFAVPSAHMKEKPNIPSTFCNGYLTNIFYQDTLLNALYLVSVAFFVLVLKRTSFQRFYAWVQPLCLAGLGAIASIVWFKDVFSQTLLALSLSMFTSFMYIVYRYVRVRFLLDVIPTNPPQSQFVAISALPHEVYGMYAFVSGAIQTGTDLAMYIAMDKDVDNDLLLGLAFTVLVIAAAHSAAFGIVHRHALSNDGKGFC